jgi:hypothetical protein
LCLRIAKVLSIHEVDTETVPSQYDIYQEISASHSK